MYLKPITDSYEIYEREAPGGNIYFAVKTGFCLAAVIEPVHLDEADLANRLRTIHRELLAGISREKKDGRPAFIIDPDTGEVLEAEDGKF